MARSYFAKLKPNRRTLMTISLMFGILLTCYPLNSFGWISTTSNNNNIDNSAVERRKFIFHSTIEQLHVAYVITGVTTTTTTLVNPQSAFARNLPESNGADLTQTGTLPKLIPIIKMKETLINVQIKLTSEKNIPNSHVNEELITSIKYSISDIPDDEKQFKKIFDEYSDPVSYKQKYMDSNAFVVYYTNGFDGPGRDSIEKETPKQIFQYGARNDIWGAYDDFLAELKFADSNSDIIDLLVPLNKIIDGLNEYLKYAPKDDVQKATSILNVQ